VGKLSDRGRNSQRLRKRKVCRFFFFTIWFPLGTSVEVYPTECTVWNTSIILATLPPSGVMALTRSNVLRAQTSEFQGAKGAKKLVILCVEDDETQSELRRKILEKDGYSVLTASTRAHAISLFRENPVCLVVADHMLQGPSGTDLARQLKQSKPDVPVLLYSGGSPESMRNIDAFLHKAEPVSRFLAMIRSLVDRYCA